MSIIRKNVSGITRSITVAICLVIAANVMGQTNLAFTGISVTSEQNIQLTWVSVSNETYEVQEADALGTNSDGSTEWNELYTEYPSQGTNTFWLDTGNYSISPAIVIPKNSSARFYRLVDLGPDTTTDEPTVNVIIPTNGLIASGSLTVTVIASTDQPLLTGTKLYVDGQEMQMADINLTSNWVDSSGVTNYEQDTYILNTCEWPNGQHLIFATTRCASGPEGGPFDTPPVAIGHAVSPFVPVTFNNLVTRISFSQPFFDPSLGETQIVSAVFASDADWTLEIVDSYTNEVKTATGSGVSMSFNWDGTDDGGTTVPPGNYWYLISAATNGETPESETGGGTNSTGGPPSMDASSAISGTSVNDSEDIDGWEVVELPPAPPGMSYGTNDDGTPVRTMTVPRSRRHHDQIDGAAALAAFGADSSPTGSGSPPYPTSSQNAPQAPVRPPNAPVAGTVGHFGVMYQTYSHSANGTNGYYVGAPQDGLGGGQVQLGGQGGAAILNYTAIPNDSISRIFVNGMGIGGWSPNFVLSDDQVTIGNLSGAGTPLNNVDLGILMLHGIYGTSQDFTANGAKQMYFPITAGQSCQYIRMSDMLFGGSAPNVGLKWMAIFACTSLYQADWQSMMQANVKPYNGNLHLLLGLDTIGYATQSMMAIWASLMFYGQQPGQMPIEQAWFQAGIQGYKLEKPTYAGTIKFAVAGDSACSGDTLTNFSTPTGSWFYTSQQVFP